MYTNGWKQARKDFCQRAGEHCNRYGVFIDSLCQLPPFFGTSDNSQAPLQSIVIEEGIDMKTARMLFVGAATLLCMAPFGAKADHKMYQGRTGLPSVKAGNGNVWVERANVNLEVRGSNLVTTQEFRLHYPGGKLEKGMDQIQVGVREDYFRATDNNAGDVTESEAKGFNSFDVSMDGRKLRTTVEPWRINDKKDTATRWRNWWITFSPGKVHTMRVVSSAPLGWEEGKRTVEFVSKDLGHWRDLPDVLEIRFMAPGRTEARVAGLEPKPDNINRNAVRWIYRKMQPKRNIYIQLPPGSSRRGAMR